MAGNQKSDQKKYTWRKRSNSFTSFCFLCHWLLLPKVKISTFLAPWDRCGSTNLLRVLCRLSGLLMRKRDPKNGSTNANIPYLQRHVFGSIARCSVITSDTSDTIPPSSQTLHTLHAAPQVKAIQNISIATARLPGGSLASKASQGAELGLQESKSEREKFRCHFKETSGKAKAE